MSSLDSALTAIRATRRHCNLYCISNSRDLRMLKRRPGRCCRALVRRQPAHLCAEVPCMVCFILPCIMTHTPPSEISEITLSHRSLQLAARPTLHSPQPQCHRQAGGPSGKVVPHVCTGSLVWGVMLLDFLKKHKALGPTSSISCFMHSTNVIQDGVRMTTPLGR